MLVKGDKRIIRSWAMYDWANSAYSLTITSAIFPGFFEAVTSQKDAQGNVIQDFVADQYGIVNTSLYSYTISLSFLVVALLAPILSGIADYTDKKKAFMQFFCYLGAISCAGLYFFDFDMLWLGMTCFALAGIGFSGSIIFYNAYLPLIAEPEDHDRVSALGFSLGYVGSVILLLWNLSMLLMPELYFDVQGAFEELKQLYPTLSETELMEQARDSFSGTACRISFLSVGIWWALFAQVTFRVLPGHVEKRKVTRRIILNGYRELRGVWNEAKKTVRLKRFLQAYFLYNTAVQTVMYMAANFAAKEIKQKGVNGEDQPFEPQNLIITILIIQLVAILGSWIFAGLSRRYGNLKTLGMAVICWIVICTAAYQVVYEYPFYALAACVGLVMGGIQSLSRSTYSKFIPETFDTASYFSFYNVCYYVGTVLGTFGFGYVLDLTGDIRLSILSIASFFILGFLMLLRVPKEEMLVESA